jgi:hypothetical protein
MFTTSHKAKKIKMEEEKKVRRTYLLSIDTIEKIEAMAAREKRKFSAIIERLVESAYEQKTS